MVIIQTHKLTDTRHRVIGIFEDTSIFDGITLDASYVEVADYPKLYEIPANQVAKLYYNPVTGEMWHEFDAVEIATQMETIVALKEENKELKAENALIQQAIDDIILNGGTL